MIKQEFIPYEQALELKELGFNENCLARFDGSGFRMLPVYDPLKNNEVKESWFCVTPLYQQVFRWFREKYNLWNMIYPRDGWNYTIQEIDNIPSVFGDSYHKTEMRTYEEAEIECLKKLIEICKKIN